MLLPDRMPRWLGIVTCGALPILLPVALHPAEAAPVLATMAGWDPAVMQSVLSGAAWLLPAWVVAFGWIISAAWREGQRVSERLATAAGVAVGAVFWPRPFGAARSAARRLVRPDPGRGGRALDRDRDTAGQCRLCGRAHWLGVA